MSLINVIGALESKPKLPPIADAGDDQTVYDSNDSGDESIQLDGSGSSAPESSIVSYIWTWSGGSASGVSPSITLPVGTTVVTLTVTNAYGGTASDTVEIIVEEYVENPPPVNEGYVMPVPYTVLKYWDWQNEAGRQYTRSGNNRGTYNGVQLMHQYNPTAWPTVRSAQTDPNVAGSLNGYALWHKISRAPSGSDSDTRRNYARMELRYMIERNTWAAQYMGLTGGDAGMHWYVRLNQPYVYQIRMKPHPTLWEREPGRPSRWTPDENIGDGEDNYCGIIDIKQDIRNSSGIRNPEDGGTPYRERDATFRIRMYNDYANIVVNGATVNAIDYIRETPGHVHHRTAVHVPELFDGNFHTWTIHAKWYWTGGYIYVYLDNRLIYQITNTCTAYREDDYPGLGPFTKLGLYDSGIFTLNSGSDEKQHYLDYFMLGIYDPNGKGIQKYSGL